MYPVKVFFLLVNLYGGRIRVSCEEDFYYVKHCSFSVKKIDVVYQRCGLKYRHIHLEMSLPE